MSGPSPRGRLSPPASATDTVDSARTDAVEAVRARSGGFGADVVVDAVGPPETYKQAVYARHLAGTVVGVGVPAPDMTVGLPLLDAFGRGGSLKSSRHGDCLPSRDFPALIDLCLDTMCRGEVLRSIRPRQVRSRRDREPTHPHHEPQEKDTCPLRTT